MCEYVYRLCELMASNCPAPAIDRIDIPPFQTCRIPEFSDLPLVKLQRNLTNFDTQLSAHHRELDILHKRLIQGLALIRDAGVGEKVRVTATSVMTEVNELNDLFKSVLSSSLKLIQDESEERARLQHTLKKALQKNHKLESVRSPTCVSVCACTCLRVCICACVSVYDVSAHMHCVQQMWMCMY